MPRLEKQYSEETLPSLVKKFGMKNVMQAPRLKKIVLNMGIGDAVEDPKLLDEAVEELTLISGQKPVITKAKKDISNFKVRKGEKIGCKVTLRRAKMYEFMDRLFNIALPRVRDFRGVSDSGFDGKGNFTMGVREQIIFPEVDYEKVQKSRGLNITFVTNSDQDEHVYHLLKELGMPFQKR
ncbi:MAG: 50S ribosomal protein L5 [bacterium]